jgi:hypothetical protein
MPFAGTPFVNSATVLASDLIDNIGDIEDYVNQGIATGDLEASKWVKSSHIYRPDYYPGRVELISGDCHYRKRDFGTGNRAVFHEDTGVSVFRTIPGLAATFHCPNQSTAYVDILSSLYAWEHGGGMSVADDIERDPCARLAVFFDGVELSGTRRKVYASTTGILVLARKQITMARHSAAVITEGWHSVSVRLMVEPTSGETSAVDFTLATPDDRAWRHIFVEGGNLVVDIQAK